MWRASVRPCVRKQSRTVAELLLVRTARDACLPACLPAGRTVLYCTTCRYGSPHCRTGCVRNSFGIRLGFVRDSFGMPAFLPASLHACRYGSPHCRTGCVRDSFGIRSRFVRDACLPACLPACMQAGSRYSYQYGTSYHEYSYISRTRGRSYGTVGAAMRPRCGDPPNKVCRAVGKLDVIFVQDTRCA